MVKDIVFIAATHQDIATSMKKKKNPTLPELGQSPTLSVSVARLKAPSKYPVSIPGYSQTPESISCKFNFLCQPNI